MVFHSAMVCTCHPLLGVNVASVRSSPRRMKARVLLKAGVARRRAVKVVSVVSVMETLKPASVGSGEPMPYLGATVKPAMAGNVGAA